MAIILIMMASVATIFEVMGTSVNDSRATIEMSSRLRNSRNRLQQDLASTSCPLLPWNRPAAGDGYFEYTEGPLNDLTSTAIILVPGASLVPTNVSGTYAPLSGLGDYDDILMFTVRSQGEPFVGRGLLPNGNPGMIESPVAEVIWYAVENPDVAPNDPSYLGEPGMRTLYRRVLLVAPRLDLRNAPRNSLEYYRNFDISARLERGARVANSLSDLTKRENRFAHRSLANGFPNPNIFPHWLDLTGIYPVDVSVVSASPLRPFGPPFDSGTPPRQGEDVMLTNVLAWDVRAYDPTAPLYAMGDGTVVTPGDPGWTTAHGNSNGTNIAGHGAYVDLGYFPTGAGNVSIFSNVIYPPRVVSVPWPFKLTRGAGGLLPTATYDTWSFHYEHDGIDQDKSQGVWRDGVDQGTNGFDDDGQNGVDDVVERETSPPYMAPLRGIQVRIRVYELSSRQIREVSIQQSFVPE